MLSGQYQLIFDVSINMLFSCQLRAKKRSPCRIGTLRKLEKMRRGVRGLEKTFAQPFLLGCAAAPGAGSVTVPNTSRWLAQYWANRLYGYLVERTRTWRRLLIFARESSAIDPLHIISRILQLLLTRKRPTAPTSGTLTSYSESTLPM